MDLPLSFRTFEFFPWPPPLYLILENDAEFSFVQAPFDVFSECLQARTLTDSKGHRKDFLDQLLDSKEAARSILNRAALIGDYPTLCTQSKTTT